MRVALISAMACVLLACTPVGESDEPPGPIQTELPPPSMLSFWTVNGRPAARDTIQLHAGPEHCGWGSLTLLATANHLGQRITPLNEREYLRDPGNRFRAKTIAAFEASAARPDDAVFTGYRFGDLELWLDGPRDDVVFIVRGGIWEQWPRVVERFGCT